MCANTGIHCFDHAIEIIPIYKIDSLGYLESQKVGLHAFRDQSLQQRQLLVGLAQPSMIIDAEREQYSFRSL